MSEQTPTERALNEALKSLDRQQRQIVALKSLLRWAVENLDSPASPDAEQKHRDQVNKIYAALERKE